MKMETVWSLFQHINGKKVEMKVIVGPESITNKEQRQIIVNLIQIQQIHLWNGQEGFQAVNKPNNICFSILHHNGTEWETLGFEMNTPKERAALIMDIIDKMQPLGVHPGKGLSRQIILDSILLDESLEIPFDYDDIPMRVSQIVKEEHHLEISKELEEQKERNEKCREYLKQQREEIKRMQGEQAVMAQAKQQLEKKLTEEMEKTQALGSFLYNVQQQLREKGAIGKKENHDSKQQLSTEMEKNEELQTNVDLHQKEIERLKSELDDSRREFSDRQMEMEKAQEDLIMKHKESIEMKEAAISEIEEKNKKLEALIGTKAAAIKFLESDLVEMEKMNSKLTEENTRKQVVKEEHHLEISKQLEEQRKLNEELTRLRAENKEMRQQLSMEKERANDAQKLRIKTEEITAMTRSQNEELFAEIERLKLRLQQTVGQQEQERKAFDEKVKEANITHLEEQRMQNEKLTKDLDQQREEIKKMQDEQAVMAETEEELTESLKHQTAEFMQMKLELDSSRQELEDKNRDIERLQTVHDEMKAALEKLSERNRDLENSSSAMIEKLKAAKELLVKQGELLQPLVDKKEEENG